MYESPITLDISDISSQIREAQDGHLMYEVQQAIGYEINKEELIKALKYDRDQYQKGYEDGRKDNEWIPISEKLPEAGKQYLCCDVNGFIEVGYLSKTLGEWGFLDSEAIGEVISWMPLPEPYKEERGVSE